jgi:hypothetical protein
MGRGVPDGHTQFHHAGNCTEYQHVLNPPSCTFARLRTSETPPPLSTRTHTEQTSVRIQRHGLALTLSTSAPSLPTQQAVTRCVSIFIGANEARDITVVNTSADRLFFHRSTVQVYLIPLALTVCSIRKPVEHIVFFAKNTTYYIGSDRLSTGIHYAWVSTG